MLFVPDVLLGKTLVDVHREDYDGDSIYFEVDDGTKYRMCHIQDCCECVYIDDIIGDLEDLVGSPLLQAEEVSNADGEPLERRDGYFTWTFYKFATQKGYVTIRWYGTSNGYYSESVDFVRIK